MKSKITIARPEIERHFNSLASKVFRPSEMAEVLSANRGKWKLTASMGSPQFIDYMIKNSQLQRVEFPFPSRREVRYTWGDAPMYEVLMSLKSGGYFSHYTAMFFHELTEQIPRTIYINVEQKPPGKRAGILEQQAIDVAFRRKARVSKDVAIYRDVRICIVHGMGQGQQGVIQGESDQGDKILLTDMTRTLIDIAVRPVYSGGVAEVLRAYRLAQGQVSINELTAYLKKAGYIYPYHQAIGFYLERAGNYKTAEIELLRQFEMKYDFYLVHDMREMDYSKNWRLFFPKGF
jgi:predicted transcriptional regulator of viral defense system